MWTWSPARLLRDVIPIECGIADRLRFSMLHWRKVELKSDLEKPTRCHMIHRHTKQDVFTWLERQYAGRVGCGSVTVWHRAIVNESGLRDSTKLRSHNIFEDYHLRVVNRTVNPHEDWKHRVVD